MTTLETVSGQRLTVRCGVTEQVTSNVAVSITFVFSDSVDEDRLAQGLARALEHVPIFAGRLRPAGDSLEIVCQDSDVPMTTAEADMTVEQAVAVAGLADSGLVDDIDVQSAPQGGSPLLALRVTKLRDGGMAIGCTWNHLVGDMQSFMLLLRSWSAYVEGTEPPEVTIPRDRDAYLDTVLPAKDSGRPSYRLMEPEEAAGMGAWLARSAQETEVVQIHFTGDEADRMREWFCVKANRWLSANDALYAHILHTMRELGGDTAPRYLGFPVNIRRRMGIPPSVAGNMLSIVDLPYAPDTRPEVFAGDIRDAVGDFAQSHLNLRTDRAFVESCDQAQLARLMFLGMDPARRAVLMSSWTGFDVYGVTFGGHHPAYFCLTQSPSTFQLPWIGVLATGFAGDGYLGTLSVPAGVAEILRRPGGSAVLHRFREPGDAVPALAKAIRTLV
jgi:hypothetical protein